MYELMVVNPADWIPVVESLIKANWDETGLWFEFKPDVQLYSNLFYMGYAKAIVALDYGTPVGYCVVMCMPYLHNADYKIATNDAIFVSKDYRSTLLPGRLIKKAEEVAMEMGADAFSWHCKTDTGVAKMFARHGYQVIDSIVMKRF